MKKINLIEWLSRNSHEKQSPQRFARYAAMLLTILTLGTGQMWGNYAYLDLTGTTWWYNDDAVFRLDKNGSGNVDSYTEIPGTGVWRFDIGTYTGAATFKRMNSSRTDQWNYANVTIGSSNVFHTDDNNGVTTRTNFVINYIHGTNYIYFDNSVSNFSGNLYFVIGHDYSPSGNSSTYSTAYKMTQLTGTKLWYVKITDTWGDATYYAVVANSGTISSTDHSWGSSSLSTKGNNGYTAAYKTVYNMEGGSFLLTTAYSGNNKAMTITYYSGYSNIPTNSMTATVRTKVAGGTYGDSFNSPTTVTVQTRYLSDNGTSNTQSANVSTTAKTASKADVTTGEVNYSYTALAADAQWQFDGWGTSNSTVSSTDATYQIAAGSAESKTAKTIYAFFTRKPLLTVNKGTNGSSASGTASNNAKTSWNITATPNTGYSFSTWTTTSGNVTYGTQTSASTTATISADATITATYTENLTSITITTDGHGTITTPISLSNPYNLGVTTMQSIDATPSTGYVWNTWTISGNAALNSAATTKSNKAKGNGTAGGTGTITATFTPITYTVTYNANGGTGSTANSSHTYDAAKALTTNGFSKTGYTFSGWATTQTNADAGTIAYTNSQSVSNLSSTQGATVTLYAVWTPNKYTVSFNANGGTGSMSNQGFDYGVEESLQTNTFTKDGYHFDGWAEAEDGDVVYEDGADGCRISSTDGATVTLYAHWTKSVLTGITFAPTTAAGHVRVTATPVITPEPTGTTKICWTMWSNSACTEKVDTASFTQVGETNAVTFWTPEISGTYYIRAEYKTGSSCGGGTELNSIVRTYVVASEHNVTIKYMYDGMEIASRTQEVIPAADSIEISAPDLDGYTFSSWSLGDVILQAGAAPKPALTSSTIEIKALYDGVVIANYSKKDMIYFNNTLGWEHVYVYFYSSDMYWSNTYGTGAKYDENFPSDVKPHYRHYWGEMEQIEGTNVWRFDYQAAAAIITSGNTEINGYTNVAFTKDPQGYGYGDEEKGYQWFYETEVVRRGDFDHGMSMYVPIKDAGETKNTSTTYYNNGYWMNYPESSGYTLLVYYTSDKETDKTPIRTAPFEFNEDNKLPSTATVNLEAGRDYYFEVKTHHVTAKYYGNDGKMTTSNKSNWKFQTGKARCGMRTTAAGDYTFNWSYFYSESAYDYRMTVDYPATTGDYRIKYTDTEHTGVGTSYARYSRVINKRENGVDTVSFFIATDKAYTFAIEYITGITDEGVISWSPVEGNSVTTTAVDGAKVYNIRIVQDAVGNITSAAVIGAYTGNYYIRTDCASSQWNNYRYDPGNLMTYSEYAATKAESDYTHYFMAHAYAGTNVKFVVANDYSAYLTDTLYQSSYRGGDASHVTSSGSLNAEANIRFMWDMRDNKVIRAYLAAAKSDGSKFLVLQGTSGNIMDENGNALSDASANNHGAGNDAIQFVDKENWMYETTVQVVPSSFVKLYAVYNDATFYYYGNEGAFDKDHAIQLVTGSGSAQKVKVVYDFKIDRLVAAWQPPVSAIGSSTPINADVMLVRNHQDAGQNIRFTESGALTDVKTVYGVMQFNRWTLSNRQGANDVDPDHCSSAALIAEYHPLLPANEMKSDYERFNYFISFPFDVKVGNIFGFGTYGRHWVIKYYDGLGRATNGYWADSESNWKYITNTDEVLHAYQGYLLKLSVSRMAYDNEEVWSNNSSIMELYFPSNGAIGSITQKNETIPALSDDYRCKINRGDDTDGDRRVKDSYWRCIGVPSFADYSATLSDGSSTIEWTTGSTLPYLYEWIMETNHLQPQSTSSYSFEAMKAYLVQYAGQIIFSNVSAKNSVVARHREASEISNAEWKLTLSQDEKVVDQAFIRLSDSEDVTANFDFNHDLSKELNTGANIYTMIGYERAAANCLPLTEQTTVIPVGVVAATDGDYTISIPEGTSGVGVTLIDTETGIRTSLSALDYTINLSAGTYNDRFVLEISPIQQMPTNIDNVQGESAQSAKARKVMIDGILYIVKDGKVFDAQGKCLQ